MSGELMTTREVADHFRVHRATIYKWVRDRGFPAPTKFGERTSRWHRDEVEAWAAAQ